MASLINSETSAVNFQNYGIVINVLNRILKLLHELDMPDKKAKFDENQAEIKTLTLELLNSNLPLNEGNIATLEDTLITYGGRGSRYKDIWALVGPKDENPFTVQADGSYGVGRDSLFSIDSNNPEALVQNMPNKPHYPDGNDYSPGRFSGYSIAVNSIKKKVIDFMKILPGGEEYLAANLNFAGGRKKRHKKLKSRKNKKHNRGKKFKKNIKKSRKNKRSKIQNGGERHANFIRKDGDAITLSNGFSNLTANGDYHLVHQYDPVEVAHRAKQRKLEQLQTWVSQTFPGQINAEGNLNAVPQDYVSGRSAANIYENHQQDLISLVNWLNDPRDN